MKMKIRIMTGFLFLLAFIRHGLAWDESGHIIVAQVAFERLNPKAKTKVEQLSSQVSFEDRPYNAVTFAVWPDDIKHADRTVPHHGEFREWHYIDLGCKAGDPDLLANPPPMTVTNGEIVTALKRCVSMVKNQTPDEFIPDEKVALALIMHLVGDIHQPLHCTAHYFGSNPPKHDGGGNKIAVPKLTKASSKNLHTYWDQAYRRYRTPFTGEITVKEGPPETTVPNDSEVTKWARKAKAQAPVSSVSLNTDPTQWAKETHAIGCDFAYAKIPAADLAAKKTDLKATYVTDARKIARKQLAVAGYRLAALLNELYPE